MFLLYPINSPLKLTLFVGLKNYTTMPIIINVAIDITISIFKIVLIFINILFKLLILTSPLFSKLIISVSFNKFYIKFLGNTIVFILKLLRFFCILSYFLCFSFVFFVLRLLFSWNSYYNLSSFTNSTFYIYCSSIFI